MLDRFRDVLTFKLCVGRLGNVQSLNTLVFRFCCAHLIFCNMIALPPLRLSGLPNLETFTCPTQQTGPRRVTQPVT